MRRLSGVSLRRPRNRLSSGARQRDGQSGRPPSPKGGGDEQGDPERRRHLGDDEAHLRLSWVLDDEDEDEHDEEHAEDETRMRARLAVPLEHASKCATRSTRCARLRRADRVEIAL